jgi:cyanophycinase
MLDTKKGFLTLIGGAEDKKYDKIVLKSVLALSKPKAIAVIPTASKYGVDLGMEYVKIFKDFGYKDTITLDISKSSDAEKPEHIAFIQKCDLVFFTGGDQVKLVDVLKPTEFFKILKNRYESDNLSVAGTSAGAASAGTTLLYDGDDFGFYKESVKAGYGFDFLSNVVVDTHFMERNRIPRLVQHLAAGFCKKGIGVSENTAIHIYPNHRFEVVGSGTIVLMNAENMDYSNYSEIAHNQFISVNNLGISFLSHGYLFDLNTWRVLTDKSALVSAL